MHDDTTIKSTIRATANEYSEALLLAVLGVLLVAGSITEAIRHQDMLASESIESAMLFGSLAAFNFVGLSLITLAGVMALVQVVWRWRRD